MWVSLWKGTCYDPLCLDENGFHHMILDGSSQVLRYTVSVDEWCSIFLLEKSDSLEQITRLLPVCFRSVPPPAAKTEIWCLALSYWLISRLCFGVCLYKHIALCETGSAVSIRYSVHKCKILTVHPFTVTDSFLEKLNLRKWNWLLHNWVYLKNRECPVMSIYLLWVPLALYNPVVILVQLHHLYKVKIASLIHE